ncbi:MAG: hypothetical protein WD118_08900, partial [Phycisphaeraceae bacterium]
MAGMMLLLELPSGKKCNRHSNNDVHDDIIIVYGIDGDVKLKGSRSAVKRRCESVASNQSFASPSCVYMKYQAGVARRLAAGRGSGNNTRSLSILNA